MLSLLRNVCRRSLVPRPTLVANYTTGYWDDIGNILHEEGAKQEQKQQTKEQTKEPRKAFKGPSTQRGRRRDDEIWKPFQVDRVLRPHELTYKARIIAPRAYKTRRAALGPPPNIARYTDVFYQFNIDPLSQALNPKILSQYMSEMGKIYSRNITGLTSKSQRRIGKAIRRAKMMGVIPILSRPQQSYTSKKPRSRN